MNAGYGTPWRKLVTNQTLGSDVGINFRAFEERILVDRTHGQACQAAMEFQVRTRPGIIPGATGVNDGIGAGLVAVSDISNATKYGHFNFISQCFNDSTYHAGQEQSYGHVSAALYGVQKRVDSTPMWGIAVEVKETHGQANPTNGSLGAEITVIGTGTDAFNNRCMIFLPANKADFNDGIWTEFAQGIYWKTRPDSIYKDAMLFEGNYGNILNAREVNAGSLVYATGSYSQPVIDLGFVYQAGGNAAIQVNESHHMQWTTAGHNVVQRLGRAQDTLKLDGIEWRGLNVHGLAGYITVVINGNKLAIPCHSI